MAVYTTIRTKFGTDVIDPNGEHVEEHLSAARAVLLADALNVHEATGLIPSQLQARVAELEAALRTVLEGAECHADFSNGVVCPNTGADQGEATASEILRECRAVLERKA